MRDSAMTSSRRRFIQQTSSLALVASIDATAAIHMAPLTAISATEAVRAMRAGDLTAERYANALLAHAELWKGLNAFRTLQPERVLEAARAADKKRASGARLGALH